MLPYKNTYRVFLCRDEQQSADSTTIKLRIEAQEDLDRSLQTSALAAHDIITNTDVASGAAVRLQIELAVSADVHCFLLC